MSIKSIGYLFRYPFMRATALLSLMLLSGCADIPLVKDLPFMRSASQYSSSETFSAKEMDWPDSQWWKVYKDDQLDTLIEEGISDSPDMTAALGRLRTASASSRISAAALYPQVTGNASANEQKQSYNYLTPENMTPNGWKDYGRATLDFNWEIDFWGKNRAALAAATSEEAASKAEVEQARLTISTSIASDYAELAHLYMTRDTISKEVDVRHKTLDIIVKRYGNGLETLGAQRNAEARQAAVEGELLQVDEQIALQRNSIAALLGKGPDRGLSIKRPSIKVNRHFGLPSNLALNLLGRRPDVIASRLQAEAQAKRIDAKKADFYPNINLSAFIGVQSLGLDMLTRSGSGLGSVGPAISLPIFNAGRLKGELQQTQGQYEVAVGNYNKTVTQALQDVADVAVSQKALAGRLKKSEQAVKSAEEAYKIARKRYEGGLSNYLDVLSAEDTLLSNVRSLTDMQARSLTLDVALMRALGGGYQFEDQ